MSWQRRQGDKDKKFRKVKVEQKPRIRIKPTEYNREQRKAG